MSTAHVVSLGNGFSVEDWNDIYEYISVYGLHIVFGALLSAVTMYRREMSCNRVFHDEGEEEEEEEEEEQSSCDSTRKEEAPLSPPRYNNFFETETEELLDSAGMYCSGQPILNLASLWLDCFPDGAEEETTKVSCPKFLIHPSSPNRNQKQHNSNNNNNNSNNNDVNDVGDANDNDNEFAQLTTSDFLEKIGNYGDPIVAMATALYLIQKNDKSSSNPKVTDKKPLYDPFTNQLPPDVHIHISSFLHPKDVVSLSCVSKSYREIVDQSETSASIWRTLWRRDYAWMIHNWNVGREAWARSQTHYQQKQRIPSGTSESDPLLKMKMTKEVYFQFGQTYIDYVLAGQNTNERCLVGLHSNIYDITNFLVSHPGSPDTLMVYSGKDASRYFEDMGHSLGARRMAQRFCVVADQTTLKAATDTSSDNSSAWGLRPTQHTRLLEKNQVDLTENDTLPLLATTPLPVSNGGQNIMDGRQQRKQRKPQGTLLSVKKSLRIGKEKAMRQIEKEYHLDQSVLGNVNVYFDPFLQEWRVWYTNADLENVFASLEG